MWPEVWRDYVDLAAGGGVRVRPRAARDENRSRPDSPERPVFRVTARALVGAYAARMKWLATATNSDRQSAPL